MRPIALSLLIAAAGCSLLYPLDYRAASPDAAPDLPAPDAPRDVPAPDAPALDVPALDAPADTSQPACPMGFDRCSGASCTDLRTNTSHCGRCGNVCALANATPTCVAGACVVASCNPGFTDCDRDPANGCEANTSTDVSRCGRCDNACPTAGGTPACRDGVCRVSMCAAGFADCDGDNTNGCEADTRASLRHCGACGGACVRANAITRCVAGSCVTEACTTGFGDCDGNVTNGCETALTTTTAHCGTCGRACSSAGGTPSCAAGGCAIACAAGFADCDGDNTNGCETDTRGSFTHCGGCGRGCTTGQSCNNGTCSVNCPTGETSCAGTCANLQSSTAYCGACSVACPRAGANASSACASGACRVGCLPGFGDCDGNAANGCETTLATNVSNCGRCTNACPTLPGSAPTCSGSVCGVACAAGFGNCNGNVADGCEVTLASAVDHCGECRRACATPRGTPVCRAGACAIDACNGGFGDCNGNASDGCETPLEDTLAHCGRCNLRCDLANATPTCTGSECRVRACNVGFGDCNDDPRDGCEVNLTTSAAHCGRCTNACMGGGQCLGSECCGGVGDRCCRDGTCTVPGSTCSLAQCQPPCGGNGQPCCGARQCNPGFACGGSTTGARQCVACGGSGQPCCPTIPVCSGASRCIALTGLCG